MLVDLGANLEATDDDGQKPIHMAAQSNQPQVVRLLLDQKPNSIFLVTKVWSSCKLHNTLMYSILSQKI